MEKQAFDGLARVLFCEPVRRQGSQARLIDVNVNAVKALQTAVGFGFVEADLARA